MRICDYAQYEVSQLRHTGNEAHCSYRVHPLPTTSMVLLSNETNSMELGQL